MLPIKERTPSSLGTSALTTNNYSKIAQNKCMCFVTLSFSLIFNVCNLSFKYIVTTSCDSNNRINFVHASCDAL